VRGTAAYVRAVSDGQTVSIVDDDASFLRALHFLLRTAGFRVGVFASAEEFLRTASDTDARCLVLDVHLGARTGFEVHEGLAAAGRHIPTIFMTAHDDAPTRERARHLGAVAYLRKPFDDATLIAAIAEALGGAHGEPSRPVP
jgi:FixJ family two-component response regulator